MTTAEHSKPHSQGGQMQPQSHHEGKGNYAMLGFELAIDFVVMFFVMYSMIATHDHLYLNIGNVYMTLMMVAPMAVLMLLFMRGMYRSRARNLVVGVLAIMVFSGGWFGMRYQIGVGDAQFVRSMIPHHSGAVLMCHEAQLADPELVQLCKDIVKTQESEIARMEKILARL